MMTSRVSVYQGLALLIFVYGSDAGPVRDTVNGKVEGMTKSGFTKGDVDFFYGIPYAKPPVVDLRFEDPVEPVSWTDTRDATQLPKACPQFYDSERYVKLHRKDSLAYGEDCLYLNVFQPKTETTQLAVLLFIHGGSNVDGTGLMFDGGYLASHGDIVVVTINYRLGHFGFLGTGQPELRGNYGMLDQIMSMKWVKNNIANFNGDPDKVTILGHSAGAMDVGLHLLSPLTKGLFRAVISQSGPPTSPIAWKYPRTDPFEEARHVASQIPVLAPIVDISLNTECKTSTKVEIKQCLKDAPSYLLRIGRGGYTELDAYEFCPIVDGYFLPEDPLTLIRKKNFSAQQYVIGVTTAEADAFGIEEFENLRNVSDFLQSWKAIPTGNASGSLKNEYTDLKTKEQKYRDVAMYSDIFSDAIFVVDTVRTANLLYNAGVNVTMYQWDKAPDVQAKPWQRVPHGIDLFYLFGSPLSGHHTYNFTQADRDMSKYMMDSWSNYVKNGVLGPSSDTHVSQPYDSLTRSYQRFGVDGGGQPEMTLHNDLVTRERMHFWAQLRSCVDKRTQTVCEDWQSGEMCTVERVRQDCQRTCGECDTNDDNCGDKKRESWCEAAGRKYREEGRDGCGGDRLTDCAMSCGFC